MKLLSFLAVLVAALCTESFAQSWTTVNTGTTNKLYTVNFLNANTGWIGGEGSLIRKTTNGGATWTAQSGSRNITAILFQTANVGWAVGGSGGTGVVLKTTNGGTNWISQITTGPVYWDVSFRDSLVGWITGAGGSILKTTNGGTSWVTQSSGTTTDLQHHYFFDATTGWVSGTAGMLRKTTNGGTSWVAQTSGTTNTIGDIEFPSKDTGWFAGVGGVIYKTTNGGTVWTAQTSGTTATLSALSFRNTRTGYASGNNGVLLKTTNGGANWVAQTSGTTVWLNGMHFLSDSTAWVVGDNGTLIKALSPYPAGLTYSTNPAVYRIGTPITANTPSVSGVGPFTYAASTTLPAGLSLNPSTGVITGTPTAASPSTDYVITATNIYGSTTATLNIGVLMPPYALSYSAYPAPVYIVGTAITPNTPSVVGTITQYSVSPPLTFGLALDSVTGIISGTPTVPAPSADYTITASNVGGSTSLVLNITVLLKPANLSYSVNPASYTRGISINPNTPTIQGSVPLTYSVTPSLPQGLTLNASTGIISGTPTNATDSARYTVTATNSAGSTLCTLVVKVVPLSFLALASGSERSFAIQLPGASRLTFVIPQGMGAARIEVLSTRGARVWQATRAVDSDLAWDGSAQDGSSLPAGIYAVRATWLSADGTIAGSVSKRITLLKP